MIATVFPLSNTSPNMYSTRSIAAVSNVCSITLLCLNALLTLSVLVSNSKSYDAILNTRIVPDSSRW